MRIGDLILTGNLDARLKATSKSELLKELARRASAVLGIEENAILKALADREKLGSTGFGGGIALPHARVAGLKGGVVLIYTLARPVDFNSIDDQPVDLVGVVLIPDDAGPDANAALACVARSLREPGVADHLRKADVGTDLRRLLTK